MPQLRRHWVLILPQMVQLTQVARQASKDSSQSSMQSQYELAVLHWVVTPSQVMEVPGTLVQELAGVQLRLAFEQVVVHIVLL